MSQVLSSLPERFQAERAELLELLLRHGILHRTQDQPVLSRDGTSARWMLDSLSVTLTPRGAELAGRCMVELLKRFDGRQIAAYGLTGVPILQSCILQSGGRYRGLLVRKERKLHGSLKLIEGQIDLTEPTILIDDSVSSGLSMKEGCKILEDAGLRVEGGVALVRFGWDAGYAAMQERGYHMEAVYDIWEDFMARMEGEKLPPRNPSKWFPEFQWSTRCAPEQLHPAHLARVVLLHYLESGQLMRPPRQMDADYDSSGGVWVSIRSRENIYLRHARDGFWHFPGEERWGAAEDLVRACLRTADHLPRGEDGIKLVESSSLAVTFFSALEECAVGQLDNDRYGIVVCSRERPGQMGGALPRMPGIVNEWAQFQHARKRNGQLLSFEPYLIYRHEVNKMIEPEAAWQPTGVPLAESTPWHKDAAICEPVAQRARDLVVTHLCDIPETTAPLPDDFLPADLDSVYVTVYVQGHVRGCMGTVIKHLDDDLRTLALAALKDTRFDADANPNDAEAATPDGVAVTVSLLFNPLVLGAFSPQEVAPRIRHGQQALMVYQNKRVGLLLPFVAATHNLDRAQFIAEVIDKAGITRPPYHWCRFDCATWLATADSTAILEGGFPLPANAAPPVPLKALLNRLADWHISYLIRQQEADGSLYVRYEPFQNRLHRGVSAPRLAHGAWVLARACRALERPDIEAARDKILDYHLRAVREGEHGVWLEEENEPPSISEIAFLLLALCELAGDDSRYAIASHLAATLWSRINVHGRMSTHREAAAADAYQDYFPGQALLSLSAAYHAGLAEMQESKLERAFQFYRHRFRHKRNFGQVSWLMQCFGGWWQATGNPQFAEFVFEIGDWILQYQQEKTGAFINDHQPDTPGYTTALYLEGIAVAARLAASLHDAERHDRYLASLTRGFRFLDRLIIQPRDAAVLPDAEFAVGGLRQSLYASEVRVDFVQHSLSAMLETYVLPQQA
jgi:orotate phosphoribosyltransferase/AMMECR1 domain-containing protein